MKAESLEKAATVCVNAICDSDIDMIDKVELMLNLDRFLSNGTYQDSINVLMRVKDIVRRKYETNECNSKTK